MLGVDVHGRKLAAVIFIQAIRALWFIQNGAKHRSKHPSLMQAQWSSWIAWAACSALSMVREFLLTLFWGLLGGHISSPGFISYFFSLMSGSILSWFCLLGFSSAFGFCWDVSLLFKGGLHFLLLVFFLFFLLFVLGSLPFFSPFNTKFTNWQKKKRKRKKKHRVQWTECLKESHLLMVMNMRADKHTLKIDLHTPIFFLFFYQNTCIENYLKRHLSSFSTSPTSFYTHTSPLPPPPLAALLEGGGKRYSGRRWAERGRGGGCINDFQYSLLDGAHSLNIPL